MARLLHRTQLLCLLSQGLLYDEGADDPLLQVIHKPACTLVMYMTKHATDAVRHIKHVTHTCGTCVKACIMSQICVMYI